MSDEALDRAETYRGWTISYDPGDGGEWIAKHQDGQDYDRGDEGNGLVVCADTHDEIFDLIDEAQDDWDEINGPFGVGA